MSTRTWSLETTDRGRYCRLPALTRLGPDAWLLLPRPGVRRGRGIPGPDPGLQELPRARLRQQHTSTVHEVSAGLAQTAPVGDALVARQAGWALRLQTADCLPLLLVDTRSGHYGAVHAGWRGTLAGVLRHALQALHSGGSGPGSTWMAIGPGIRACCFEIGAEVVAAFHARWGESTGVRGCIREQAAASIWTLRPRTSSRRCKRACPPRRCWTPGCAPAAAGPVLLLPW